MKKVDSATYIKILIGIIAIIGIFYFSNKHERVNMPRGGENVVAFGDSLVYGYGATSGNDFVSILSKKLLKENITTTSIVNLGVPGNTTIQGLERLQDVINLNPRVVIVLLGGNDALRKVAKKETFDNLEQIIVKIQASGAAVVLLGIRNGILTDEYKREFEALAKKYNTAFVPDVLSGVFGRKNLMSDTVHPNDEGYKIIAGRVYPELLKVLGR